LLAEADLGPDGAVAGLVVGVGCNLAADAFAPELADSATACALVSSAPVTADALLEAFLDQLGVRYATLDAVPAEYRSRLATLGRRVRVEQSGAVVEGEARDVDDDGHLVVLDDAGAEHRFTVGDVVHLRDA
jgi:BirA family biotin operon repressor/biotin-[acetyl-CoA-carboxylase] ligase